MSKMIHTPGVVNVDNHDDVTATFTVEPLHSGYGMTLGNSLRRVMLSSLAGAAITGVKFEGATHEFTAISGVKEDLVEIILNLKGVVFQVFSEDPQTLRINKKGKGVVTAADIETNADVEIVNKDQIIATIDTDKAVFTAEIVVEVGRGYRTVEDVSSKKKVTDQIAIDALFSPVRRVRYKVENTRVGQMTDLDKLVINVETDGSITPSDAFEEASAILVNQYTALAGKTRIEASAPLTPSGSDAPVVGDESDDSPALMTSIEDLNLSARTTNALVNNDIHTLKDLFALSDAELRDLKGFGSKALDEVKEKMAEMEF